jgi:Ca2+-transporting ATPase
MVLPASDQGLSPAANAQKPAEEVGLSAAQAAQALQDDGPNELSDAQKRGLLAMARDTLSDPMFALLLAAGVLYLVLGDLQEGLVLFGLVLVVLALTLYQEGKTERAIESLRDLTSPRALVLREGAALRIAGREVVRGDVLMLAEGDRVPADALLIQGAEVLVDESLLTGEPLPVDKVAAGSASTSATAGPEATLYSGTLLVRGHGLARVIATGKHSEIGRIGQALGGLNVETSPLKQQMARLVKLLALVALFAGLFLLAAYGLMRGDWLAALLAAIALAMALLPQEFTVVLTVIPALGAWRLSRQNVLTRRIAAIETLGATSVLCADKTGTLTENRMTVSELYVPPHQAHPLPSGEVHQVCDTADHLSIDYATTTELPECFHALVEYSILASVTDPFDPMEKAFHRLGQHFLQDTEHLHRDWTLMQTYGLTPELRAMSHVWQAQVADAHVVAAKGAPEAIVDLCHLDSAAQARVADAVEAMAAKGLRVLAVARARFEGLNWPAIEHDFDFEFIGLLGLADPLRAEIRQAVTEAHNAGIRVVMITGDYPATALAIAAQAGLEPGAEGLLTGDALTDLTDAELQQRMGSVRICARIAPTQKLRIVQALKAAGDVVAMTGDGVNDAPALKAAHVGVAMGGRGTDVAREAASIVLLDDNFASIVGAVRLGRRIFDNLRKSMSYILAVHVPIAGMALLPVLLGWPTVLFPLHIAFLELVIDPACSMVFENEPAESDVMQRPPRDVRQPLFGGMALGLALLQGLGALAVVLAATVWGAGQLTEGSVRALAFAVLVFTNLALIFSNRSRAGAFWAGLWVPNRTLWAVVAAALSLLGLVLYVPWLARLFLFEPLPMAWLAAAAGLGLASVLWFELLKAINSNMATR